MEIDFQLLQGREITKTFTIDHSLENSTVILRVYKETPVDLAGTISGDGNELVTFTFGSSVNSELGVFEYEVLETPSGGEITRVANGNIIYTAVQGFTNQVESLVDGEAIGGFSVEPNYKNQSILYWKYYLQPQFAIPDDEVESDNAWPLLVKYLIAKLVVHDYIVSLLKANLANSFSQVTNTQTGQVTAAAGPLKALETGPSKAEWHNSVEALRSLLSVNASGKSSFDQLRGDICHLAERVRAHIPLCGPFKTRPIVPLVGKPDCPLTDPLSLLNNV